jgi:hypothetical protein
MIRKKINGVVGMVKYYCRSNILRKILGKKTNEVLGTAKFLCRVNISLEDL